MGNLFSDCIDDGSPDNRQNLRSSMMNADADEEDEEEQQVAHQQLPSSFQPLLDLYNNSHKNISPFWDDASLMSTPVKKHDYRGFVFLIHPKNGILLLQCSKPKKNKPCPHFQVPGGHVDDFEFKQQHYITKYPLQQLYGASKCGCARELFEETGMDLRHTLDRFQPVILQHTTTTNNNKKKNGLRNEHKHRLFFIVCVNDSDFMSSSVTNESLSTSLGESSIHAELHLKLSDEHTGFMFENRPEKAIELIRYHSGGKVAKALALALQACPKNSL